MSLSKKTNRTFWERLGRGLSRHKRVSNFENLFTNPNSPLGEDAMMGRIGKVSSQFGMNYAQGSLENRMMRYKQYEVMDVTEPMCVNALDAYASNAVLPDVMTGHRLIIDSPDSELKDDLEELFYITVQWDSDAWSTTRCTAKYGDWGWAIGIDETGKKGVIGVAPMPFHTVTIDWEETEHGLKKVYRWGGNNVGSTSDFLKGATRAKGKSAGKYDKEQVFEETEVLHFSVKGDPVFEPFGKSIYEQARFPWQQLRLMEDAMLIYRVVRSPERKVFKIEVGGLPNDQLRTYLQQAMQEVKRTPIVDPTTGDLNMQYNVMSILEDYVFPQRMGVGSSIDTLPGGQNTDAIADVEYFKSKLRMALKVPKAFIEYDEQLATARGLAMEDQRFASNIKSLQNVMVQELYKLAVIHLLAKGYPDDRINNFELKLTNPSTQEEKDRLEILQIRNSIASDILNSKTGTMRYVRQEIHQFTNDEVAKMETEEEVEAKRRWMLAQLETNGRVMSPEEMAAAAGGGEDSKAFSTSLGGGGGGGDFGSGLSDMGSGGGLESGGGMEGAPDLGGFGAEANAELGTTPEAPNTGEPVALPPSGTETPETNKGGTETAEMDPLRIVGDKLVKKSTKNETRESYEVGSVENKLDDRVRLNSMYIDKILRDVKRLRGK